MVDTTSANGYQLSETVSLQRASGPAAEPAQDGGHPSVAFSVTVGPPRRGPCIFALQAGKFETCTMPENIEQLWGPISLPTLPEGVPNTCIVASHRCEYCVHTVHMQLINITANGETFVGVVKVR